MYRIVLYESGRFVSQIGGPIKLVLDAASQIEKLKKELNGIDVDGLLGIKFDRNGTTCSLLVITEYGDFVKNI